MTYERLMEHAEDLRRLAVDVAMAIVEHDPLRRRGVERAFADVPDEFRAVAHFPDPQSLGGPIDGMGSVLDGLSTGEDRPAEPGLARIGAAVAMLGGWSGEAAERFRDGFLAPWPAFVRNQYTVAAVLHSALVAEREIWARARQDADRIAEQGLAAVAACTDCTRTEWTVTFTVMASVAAVVAVPLGGVPGVVLGGVAAVGQVMAVAGPDDPPRTSFSADDPGEVVERVREAIRQLLGHVHERRAAVAEALRKTGQLVADRPELFGWKR
ncbi:hypothetical protein [Dactylosporangium sp. CA-139066]|uniref:hypothetical protein n=1 Tax=Dactylosporangium sp. CA-139066 TaxID=3239930 RepID=UPI003D92F099